MPICDYPTDYSADYPMDYSADYPTDYFKIINNQIYGGKRNGAKMKKDWVEEVNEKKMVAVLMQL